MSLVASIFLNDITPIFVLAGIDTYSALTRNALVDPEYIAAVGALCSGYFLGRSWVVAVRVERTATL